MTVGILGGGQLGYMLALAGYPLGLHFRFLDPSPEAPVGRIAQRVTANYTDQAALEKFASGLELVTYEFENVPVEAANFLAGRVPVYPPPAALEAAQDRLAEKNLFRRLGIATTEFAPVSNPAGRKNDRASRCSQDFSHGLRRQRSVDSPHHGGRRQSQVRDPRRRADPRKFRPLHPRALDSCGSFAKWGICHLPAG